MTACFLITIMSKFLRETAARFLKTLYRLPFSNFSEINHSGSALGYDRKLRGVDQIVAVGLDVRRTGLDDGIGGREHVIERGLDQPVIRMGLRHSGIDQDQIPRVKQGGRLHNECSDR